MTNDPHIPMSPEELPQQRIHEVAELPERPEPFECHVGYGEVPKDVVPKTGARSPIYLAQTEWAWSPYHNRLDAYHLHRGRRNWILWNNYWDFNRSKWEWEPVGSVGRQEATERQAAVYLVVEFWREEARESDVDQFHWINEGAYLSVADLMSIAREVW